MYVDLDLGNDVGLRIDKMLLNGMTDRNREGAEWDERKWKREVDIAVKADGLGEWKNRMDRNETLRWYREKGAPKNEAWYDSSLGGDLLFRVRAQCVEVNDMTYRWSEDRRKECEMCDKSVDETVVHLMLECKMYERARADIMRVFLN